GPRRGGPTGEEIFSRQHSSTIQFSLKTRLGIESGGYRPRIHRSYNDTDNGTNKKMMSEPTVCLTNIGPKESHKRLVMGICIGILNHLFFWPEQYRRTGRISIVFLFDENPDVASAGSGRRSGRRRAKCAGSRRSLELRASGAVGSRWQP